MKEKNCICNAFFFDPGEDGTPACPVHQPKLYGAGEPERHTYCPDENARCQHGDDMNCPKLVTEFSFATNCPDGQKCGATTTGCRIGHCQRTRT